MCDIYFASVSFNIDSEVPLSSAQKVFLPTAQHDLLIHFYFFWEISSSPERLFVLQLLFCSRRFARFGCFQYIQSSCQAASAISTFRYTATVLDIIYLTWCRIWPYSILAVAKKFGTVERIIKCNLYIKVQISDGTFTKPLTSKKYIEWTILNFLIAAELPPLHRTSEGFDCFIGMRISVTCWLEGQMFTLGCSPIYWYCSVLKVN